jgi:hypothetical protein
MNCLKCNGRGWYYQFFYHGVDKIYCCKKKPWWNFGAIQDDKK